MTSPLLGRPRLHVRRTGSTSDRARELAMAGAPHGTLVTAGEQTAGRGRQGRTWCAPAGSALLMSLVLRRETSEPADELLSLRAGVAVCDAVGRTVATSAQAGTENAPRLKWPNDIVVGERLAKLGGILVEARPQEGWAVLGIGLNVAVRIEQLPPELRPSAGTLGLAPSEIEPLLDGLLGALERRLEDPAAAVLERWSALDALRGREIGWAHGRGRAAGIDGQGRLIVELSDGQRVSLAAGEVHLGPGATQMGSRAG